jgi:hypothetical protein
VPLSRILHHAITSIYGPYLIATQLGWLDADSLLRCRVWCCRNQIVDTVVPNGPSRVNASRERAYAARIMQYAWSMAFEIPSHLPRKATSQDASSQLLSQISSANVKSLNADTAASWVAELDLAILESKERPAFGFCKLCTNISTGKNTREDKCEPPTIGAAAYVLEGGARTFRHAHSKCG